MRPSLLFARSGAYVAASILNSALGVAWQKSSRRWLAKLVLGGSPVSIDYRHLSCLNSRHLSCLNSIHLSCLNSRHLSCLNRPFGLKLCPEACQDRSGAFGIGLTHSKGPSPPKKVKKCAQAAPGFFSETSPPDPPSSWLLSQPPQASFERLRQVGRCRDLQGGEVLGLDKGQGLAEGWEWLEELAEVPGLQASGQGLKPPSSQSQV